MEETVPDIELKLDDYKKFIKKSDKLNAIIEIDPNGNWLSINNKGEILATLKVPSYRKATKDEIIEMEEKRLLEIKEAEKDYEEAIENGILIYQEYKKGNIDEQSVIAANDEIEDKNAELIIKKYNIFEIDKDTSIDIKKIMLNMKDDRKMPHTVYRLKRSAFELQDYVRLGDENNLDINDEEDENEINLTKNKNTIILFRYSSEDSINGYLHPDFKIDTIYNDTLYSSIEQLLAAEKARIYKNDKVRQAILKTLSSAEISKLVKGLQDPSKELEWNKLYPELLNKATFNKFHQNKDIHNKLLSTGNAVLANASKDKMNGIGFRVDKAEALDMASWTGSNLYGKAVMAARTKLKVTDGGSLKGSESYKESAISEDEYNNKVKNARMWAIINNRRKMGGYMGNQSHFANKF
jgi:ribA/ribD-fused uncharacterized protein